jgi:hypothetical protein
MSGYVTPNYQLVEFEPYQAIRSITLTLPPELETIAGIPWPVQSSHIQVSLMVDGSPLICAVTCQQEES